MTLDELHEYIEEIHSDGYSHGRGEDADYDFEKQAILEAFVKLHEENARLRGLIKEAQWNHGEGRGCPWCFEIDFEHTDKCPACTRDGEVK